MASTYLNDGKNRYDLAITNVGTGGTGTDLIGMMLAQNNGVPIYGERETRFLADQFFTGTPDQAFINPEEELPLGQNDWRSGFGLEFADASDALRYYSSIGCDLRFKDRALAGPISTAITLPTHTDQDWNFGNATADPDPDWTDDDNVLASAGSATNPDVAGFGGFLYVFFPAMSASSTRFTWDESSGNVVDGYDLDAYYDGVWNGVVELTAGNPSPGTVTTSLGATKTVTALRLRMWYDQLIGQSSTVSIIQLFAESAVIQSTVPKLIEFNSELYGALGNSLIKLNAGGTAFTVIRSFLVDITDLELFSDDKLYIALGLSNAYWEMNTSEAFTENTLSNNNMKYLRLVHTTVDTMYGSDGVNTIRSTTNPANGGTAWSAQTTVGSSLFEITKLLEKAGAVYIMKEDLPYFLDSSGNVQNNLALDLITETKSTDNGKNAFIWQNNLYLHWGDQTLLEVASANTFLNPADFSTDLTDFNGKIFAITGDNRFLFAILDNSAKIEVLSGRREVISGATRWVWHPIHELTLAGCETAFVSSIFKKRLWITSTSLSDNVYFIDLPTGYGDMLNDANRSFKTDSYFITSFYHGNFRLTKKGFIKAQATLGHAFDTDIYWELHYQKLGDSVWTDAGDFKGTSTDRNPVLFIPNDAGSNKPTSTMMRFKLVAKTDDTTKTPELLGLNITSLLYPTRKSIIECTVRVSKETILKNSLNAVNDYDIVKTTLDNAKDAEFPLSMRDIDGTTRNVKFLPIPDRDRFIIIRDEKGREQERHYRLRMQVVPLS